MTLQAGTRLADAYRTKNDSLSVIYSKASPNAKPKLVDWLFSAKTMDLPKFHDYTKAYQKGYFTICVTFLFSEKIFLQYIKIVPEWKLRHDPKLFYFDSIQTIDIEPLFYQTVFVTFIN